MVQRQFEQLVDLTRQSEIEKVAARQQLDELKRQIELQRQEQQDQMWDFASRSAHYQFDQIKQLPLETIDRINKVTLETKGYKPLSPYQDTAHTTGGGGSSANQLAS